MEQKRIDEITARCEAATPGPWDAVGFLIINLLATGPCNNDRDFIAHAHQDLPDLLTEISHSHKECEMLWRKVGELEAEVERLRRVQCELIDVLGGNKKCEYCKSYWFCKVGGCICLTEDVVRFEWRGPTP